MVCASPPLFLLETSQFKFLHQSAGSGTLGLQGENVIDVGKHQFEIDDVRNTFFSLNLQRILNDEIQSSSRYMVCLDQASSHQKKDPIQPNKDLVL